MRLTLLRCCREIAARVVAFPAAAVGSLVLKPRMVPVMCRKLAMIAVLGGLAAGLGCQHIGGKDDCGYNPANYPMPAPTTPYEVFPLGHSGAKPPADPTPMPKAKAGSDAEVKENPKVDAKDKSKGN
jgi:hypothetical protein